MSLKNVKKIVLINFLGFMMIACSSSNDIQTTKPHQGHIQASFTELARTQLENIYDINMPLSGEIEHITPEPGDSVKKDQIIAQLILLPWQQNVLETQAKLDQINIHHTLQQRELKRQEDLYKKGFVNQSAIDNIRSQVKTLKTQLQQAKASLSIAQYHLKLTTIRSPIDGVILKRRDKNGYRKEAIYFKLGILMN